MKGWSTGYTSLRFSHTDPTPHTLASIFTTYSTCKAPVVNRCHTVHTSHGAVRPHSHACSCLPDVARPMSCSTLDDKRPQDGGTATNLESAVGTQQLPPIGARRRRRARDGRATPPDASLTVEHEATGRHRALAVSAPYRVGN